MEAAAAGNTACGGGAKRLTRAGLVWAAASASAATLFATLLSRLVFAGLPHVADSIVQVFQARIFADGRLWVPSPPLREFFDYSHMINDGRWYSQYPPGHALLLVPGVWLGAPWLTNPILGGLSVFAIFLLARELFDEMTARIAAILGVLSPFLIFMASEFMSHVSGLCTLTFFLFFYFRMTRTGHIRSGMAAGACLGFAVLIRPYTAFAMALPAGIQTTWLLYKDRFRLLYPVLALTVGGFLGVVLFGLYNWRTTGDPFLPGYIKLYGPSVGLGFGKGIWTPPHTLARGLGAAWSNVASINSQLFGWPLTSLWALAVALLPWTSRDRRDLGLRLFLASFPLCLLLAYVFFWNHDLCFGPRYLYEALGPLLVLSAIGLRQSGIWLGKKILPRATGWHRAAPGATLVLFLFVCAGASSWPALLRRPQWAGGGPPGSPLREASYFFYYSPEFWGVGPYLHRLVAREKLDRALVFTHFTERRSDSLPERYVWFGSAFAWEDPDLERAQVIFAHDRGNENARLAALFPGREVYLYTGTIEEGRLVRHPEWEAKGS
jgi:hypothetical protein